MNQNYLKKETNNPKFQPHGNILSSLKTTCCSLSSSSLFTEIRLTERVDMMMMVKTKLNPNLSKGGGLKGPLLYIKTL